MMHLQFVWKRTWFKWIRIHSTPCHSKWKPVKRTTAKEGDPGSRVAVAAPISARCLSPVSSSLCFVSHDGRTDGRTEGTAPHSSTSHLIIFKRPRLSSPSAQMQSFLSHQHEPTTTSKSKPCNSRSQNPRMSRFHCCLCISLLPASPISMNKEMNPKLVWCVKASSCTHWIASLSSGYIQKTT